jgi:hypothetical protein
MTRRLCIGILALPIWHVHLQDLCRAAEPFSTIWPKAIATARLVESYEFKATIDFDDGHKVETTHIRSGHMYYIHRKDLVAGTFRGRPLPLFNETYAFNGTIYQDLDSNKDALRLSEIPLPPLTPSLHFGPYDWLTRGSQRTPSWEVLRDDQVWRERFESGKFIADETLDGLACTVVEFPHERSQSDARYRVHFAADLGYYPLRYQRILPNGSLSTDCHVTSYMSIDSTAENGVFPLELVYEETGADGLSTPQRYEIVADPKTVRINVPIADEVFTISPERAFEVLDQPRIAEHFKQTPASSAPSRLRAWLVVITVCIALVLSLLVIRERLIARRGQL